MSMDSSHISQAEKAPTGNRTSLLPFILYKNHIKAMGKVQHNTDTGLSSPEKERIIRSKKIRHEINSITQNKRK